ASISFVIVLSLLAWKAWPAIKAGLKAREDRIRGDLERAEQAKQEAEALLEEYRGQLAQARGDATQIIEEARQQAGQVRRDLVARAETDAAEIRARASDDVRLATERAMSELHSRVVALSIDLAERVIERNLDRPTQEALVESFMDQVGSN